MMGHTHALIGSCLSLAIALVTKTDANTTAILLAAGGLAALLPDIDHPRAPLRRRLGVVGNVAFGSLKHRGLTHTLIALVAIASAALTALPGAVGLAVAVGYGSHIVADMWTVSGLPVLWPYKKESYHLLPRPLRITTNTLPEHLIALGLLVVIGSQLPHFIPRL